MIPEVLRLVINDENIPEFKSINGSENVNHCDLGLIETYYDFDGKLGVVPTGLTPLPACGGAAYYSSQLVLLPVDYAATSTSHPPLVFPDVFSLAASSR